MPFTLTTFGWLYGVLAIASTFIAAGMARLWLDRVQETARPHPDAYIGLLFFAGLHGFAGAIYWTLRAWDAIVNGRINTGSFALLTLLATLLYAAGKVGLVYVSANNSKPMVWRVFVGVALMWSVLVWWSVLRA